MKESASLLPYILSTWHFDAVSRRRSRRNIPW